jgi:hypothetical protein
MQVASQTSPSRHVAKSTVGTTKLHNVHFASPSGEAFGCCQFGRGIPDGFHFGRKRAGKHSVLDWLVCLKTIFNNCLRKSRKTRLAVRFGTSLDNVLMRTVAGV